VPEQHTDFIFCTVGEEYGFVGSTLFIVIYLLLIGRIYYLAERQKNVFSRVFGYSTASILFFHFFVNIGMALGILPVIGIPLPFMSYGGSSLISFSMLLFTFLKLDANRINEISRLN
jgi:rod shape determining protein RodA